MNPMALLFALLASAGAVGALSGGRQRNVEDDGQDSGDDGDTIRGGDGGNGNGGSGNGGSGSGGGGGNGSGGGTGTGTVDPIKLPKPPVQNGGTGEDGGSVAPTPITGAKVSIMAGRMKTLDPDEDNVASIRIVDQPAHGHVSVNPDNTFAVVFTDTTRTGSMSFSYEVTHTDGTTSLHTTPLEVSAGMQDAGWGTGENHYMLETDANDNVVVEHGEQHRAVYITGNDKSLTLAEIAAREGLAVDKITGSWLAAHPEYGTKDLPLAEDAGMRLWGSITNRRGETSNWLMFERGYTYEKVGNLLDQETSGESELNPIRIGAWGEGRDPEITKSQMFMANENVVIQDIHFSGGVRTIYSANMLFDDAKFTNQMLVAEISSGITVRNSEFLDIHYEDPQNAGSVWSSGDNKIQGLYASKVSGLLLENNFFDMSGWEKDYSLDGSVNGGQPPSKFSHNMYIQNDNTDVTLRDTISMRGASWGAQVRSGGFIEDNVFLDNNAGLSFLGGMFGTSGPIGNYSLVSDNLITDAGMKNAPDIGALDWGMTNSGHLSTIVDNIVAHMIDPTLGQNTTGGTPLIMSKPAYYDDTIVWNWGTAANVSGLDPAIMNQTTIQRFTAELLGKPNATINDLATYLRAQGNGTFDDVVDADLIIRFFQSGFGIEPDIRTDSGMVRFIPDELGDGVRWDNRLNWSTGDLPGSVRGDSVDLGGNKVVFGGTVKVDELEFGPNGGLQVEHGKLTVEGGMETGKEGATLDVNGSGQVWTDGGSGTGKLDIDVTGGRFANTGDFQMKSDLTASGGQTLLGVDDATYAVTKGSRLEIVGDDGKVGFDGNQNGISILGIGKEGTLAFTADDGKLGSIEEFRSGALGDEPKVLSGVDLGGGKLQLDLTELVDASGTYTLVDVDELIGSFSATNITGLGGRNAEIVIDYDNDSILLKLAAGAGAIKTSFVGAQSDFDDGEADLMKALTDGRGTYDDARQAEDDEDYIYEAA